MNVKEQVDKVKEYFKEVYLETKRVTFPSRKETMKGTYVVLITVVIAAAFLGRRCNFLTQFCKQGPALGVFSAFFMFNFCPF